LDKAFIGAPQDFRGTMAVTAKLYSPGNDLLQTKLIRLEWVERQVENLSASEAIRSADAAPPPAAIDLASSIQATDAIRLAAAAGTLPQTKRESAPHTIADRRRPLKAPRRTSPAEPVLAYADIGRTQTRTAEAMKQPPPAEKLDALLKLAERLLQEGDIATARVSLRHAAEAGSAKATFDLGMSFDPSFLNSIGAGAASDPVQAAKWYARAMKLGQKDARRALKRLAGEPNSSTPCSATDQPDSCPESNN
jgi:TPR repeat protein